MAEFRIDQTGGAGAGITGRSRHDLQPGHAITLVATAPTGIGVTYAWEIIDAVGSTATLSSSSGSSVTLGDAGTVVQPCAFLIKLTTNDNGVISTVRRIASVRTAAAGLRLPVFPETAPNDGTLDLNDPDSSTDNAEYSDRAGRGAAGQNWRGWGEWAYEVTRAVEDATGNLTGPASGDLSGSYPDPTVVKLQGRAVVGTAPTEGQVLVWNDSAKRWEPGSNQAPPSGPAGGDLSGSYPDPTVDGIQGVAVAPTAPADGQVLTYDADTSLWSPATPTQQTRYQTATFNVNGPLEGLVVPTYFEDGLRVLGQNVTITAVYLTQETGGAGGTTEVRLFKVSALGTETQITPNGTLALASSGGNKATVVSTTFNPGTDVIDHSAGERLGMKLISVQSGSAADLSVAVVFAGAELPVPAGIPESTEIVVSLHVAVLGTTYGAVASVYAEAGTIIAADTHFLFGTDDPAGIAELQLVRESTGDVVTTVQRAGTIDDVSPDADIVIPATGWYTLRIRATTSEISALFEGALLVYTPSEGGRRFRFGANANVTTSAETVGAVYLPEGTIQATSKIFAGAADSIDGFTLELRREATSDLIATWSSTGLVANRELGVAVAVPAEGWYLLNLAAVDNGGTGRALLLGVDIVVIT